MPKNNRFSVCAWRKHMVEYTMDGGNLESGLGLELGLYFGGTCGQKWEPENVRSKIKFILI